MPTGILGGSFNPPHCGHLRLAEAALASGLVGKVLLVPAALPPHKAAPAEADPATRLAMTGLLAASDPRLEADGIELERPGPSYSVDTVRALRGRHPREQYRLIMGSDMAAMFAKWHRRRELIELAPPLVAERPDAPLTGPLTEMFPGLSPDEAEVMAAGRFAMPPTAISSTLIRRRLAEGAGDGELAAYMPAAVLGFIREKGLYVPDGGFGRRSVRS